MVRATYGHDVDDALALLGVAGVPQEARRALCRRLAADRRVVAAALDLCQAPEGGREFGRRLGVLRLAVARLGDREEEASWQPAPRPSSRA